MSRLGVSVVSSNSHKTHLQDELPKSTEDQVAEIMAQARDEVMLAPSTGTATDVIPIDGKGTGSGASKIRDMVATIVDDEDDPEETKPLGWEARGTAFGLLVDVAGGYGYHFVTLVALQVV